MVQADTSSCGNLENRRTAIRVWGVEVKLARVSGS